MQHRKKKQVDNKMIYKSTPTHMRTTGTMSSTIAIYICIIISSKGVLQVFGSLFFPVYSPSLSKQTSLQLHKNVSFMDNYLVLP